MAAKGTGKGRNPAQGHSRVSRARPAAGDGRDQGLKNTSLTPQTSAKPGPMAPGASRGRGKSAPPPKTGSAVRDQSSAATGTSIFQKADARNRMLGRRNRPTA